jgi:hypothetical protein
MKKMLGDPEPGGEFQSETILQDLLAKHKKAPVKTVPEGAAALLYTCHRRT